MGNDKHASRVRNKVQVDGKLDTPDTTEVEVLLQDDNKDVLWSRGTTVPTADEAGFAKGSLFIKTDVADGTKALYENQGTNLLSDFNLIGDISTAEIADDAITTVKIVDDAVTTPKIVDDAVTTAKIIDEAVTEDKLADDAVGTDNIIDDAVDIDKIDNSVIKFIDVQLSASEIKNLAGTNIELVPASEAGAGFAIIPIAVNMRFTTGTEVLTESDDNLALVYSGSTELMEIEITGFLDQATNENRHQGQAVALMTPEENVAIDMDNNGTGEIAGNATEDATLDIRVFYRVVPVL